MQKQQDMGEAHWLSKPTLVGGLSLSTPGTTGPQRQGFSAYTHSPSTLPKCLNSSPLAAGDSPTTPP